MSNVFTKEQLEQMQEVAENQLSNLIWKDKDGTEFPMLEATLDQLQSWRNHCNSMLNSKDISKPGKIFIYNAIELQKRLCNAELFVRSIVSNPNIKTSKYDLGNIIMTFIVNNKNIPNIENESIIKIFDGLDPIFNSVKIGEVRDSCLNQLGVFKKYFTAKYIYNSGIWLSAKDDKELNLPKKMSSKDKLIKIKELCNINPNIKLRLDPKGLSLFEFKVALNIKNKNYSALTTNELELLRNKLLNNYQFHLSKQITLWESLLKDVDKILEHKYGIIEK